MDAIFAPSSADQPLSPYRQIKTNRTKKNSRGFFSRPNENLAPTNYGNIINGGGGLLFAPPPASLSFSYPSATPHSFFNPVVYQQQPQHHKQPLLPPPRSRSLSCPKKKPKKPTRDQSFTPKKSKQPFIKKGGSKPVEMSLTTLPLGPDPNDLPKDVKVLSPTSFVAENNDTDSTFCLNGIEKFSGNVFTLSPPPSSLPLPRFSLKPKLSCTAEAAGVDAGATNNLRRLLRLP